jgi:imidazole glycerol-phosphate synthase subunit HisH
MSKRITIAVIDYEMGNLRSVSSALAHLGAEALITADPAEVSAADGVIFPGVGAFGDAARALEARGLTAALRDVALRAADGAGQPFLGICLGLQMLFAESEEAPGVEGLGVLPGKVMRFSERDADERAVKVPHMGWNQVEVANPNPLTASLSGGEHFYFVHSFYALTEDGADTALSCDYAGVKFTAMAARGKLFATQFHPEKSQAVGLGVLKSFVELCS